MWHQISNFFFFKDSMVLMPFPKIVLIEHSDIPGCPGSNYVLHITQDCLFTCRLRMGPAICPACRLSVCPWSLSSTCRLAWGRRGRGICHRSTSTKDRKWSSTRTKCTRKDRPENIRYLILLTLLLVKFYCQNPIKVHRSSRKSKLIVTLHAKLFA